MSDQPDIIISRDGAQYGPYTLQQVKDFLAAGNFLATDFAWDGKHFAWITIHDLVTGNPAPPPAPVAEPMAAPATTPAPPVAPPKNIPARGQKRPSRPRKGPRNVFFLIAMFFVWAYLLAYASSFIIMFGYGVVIGDLNQTGQQLAETLRVPLFMAWIVSVLLSLGLTVSGKLPGTGRPRESDNEYEDTRDAVFLTVMTIFWWAILGAVLTVATAIGVLVANGIFEWTDPQRAEQMAGLALGPLLFWGSLALSISLSVRGYLPGTWRN